MRGRWGLPLLTKELLEQAARRRTYLVRSSYVALMCLVLLQIFQSHIHSYLYLDNLGQGKPMLQELVWWQFMGIYVVVPAVVCGVVTIEKERNTLGLLFLTKLGPWTIVLEKLLSRLVPIGMFLFSMLPLMVITYTMGGLTFPDIFFAVWLLISTAVMVSSVGVMCSTFASTTTAAFIQTYIALGLLSMLPTAVDGLMGSGWLFRLSEQSFRLLQRFAPVIPAFISHWIYFSLTPMSLYTTLTSYRVVFPNDLLAVTVYFVMGLPPLVTGGACIVISRFVLYRRAYSKSSNMLLRFFRSADSLFFWLNRKVKYDVKLVKEVDSLPDFEPVAWRETTKRSLGQFRYLVRISIPLMIPVLITGTIMLTSQANELSSIKEGIKLMIYLLWIVGTGLIALTAMNLVPIEYSRQTWDVLLTTPQASNSLILQKMRAVRRVEVLCAIPILISMVLQGWWQQQVALYSTNAPGQYPVSNDSGLVDLLFTLPGFFLWFELIGWIALWAGIRTQRAIRALFLTGVISAIAMLVSRVVIFVASLVYFLSRDLDFITSDLPGMFESIFSLMPIQVDSFNRRQPLPAESRMTVWMVTQFTNLVLPAIWLCLIRVYLMRNADRCLGRLPGKSCQSGTGRNSLHVAPRRNQPDQNMPHKFVPVTTDSKTGGPA